VKTRHYDFHGVVIEVAAEEAAVGDAIDGRLRHFASSGTGQPDVRFEYRSTPPAEPPRAVGRPVYEPPAGEVTYSPDEDVLYISYEDVRVRCEPGNGRVVCSGGTDVWLLSRPFLTLPLVEILKRRGLYCVHAAGLAIDDRAVLLPGGSGSGKSTLAVALMRAGFSFLADDMVFVSGGGTSRTHGFPDETDVSDETAGFFPELRHLVGHGPEGWPKHRIRAEEVFATTLAPSCTPAALVFPQRAAVTQSRLEPLPPEQALLELAPNVLLTDPVASQAHLDALGTLARTTPAHRLSAGRDFDRIAELLRELVDG
jgi:hypothetical protein